MTTYPDSPEGVAFALLKLILSETDLNNPTTQKNKGEIFRLFRECLAVVREEVPIPPENVESLRAH